MNKAQTRDILSVFVCPELMPSEFAIHLKNHDLSTDLRNDVFLTVWLYLNSRLQ